MCDDFFGKYSEKDMFYSERESHKNIDKSTKRVAKNKEGVMNAVTDFINLNSKWSGVGNRNVDPIFLYRNDIWEEIKIVSRDKSEDVDSISRKLSLSMKRKK